MQPHEYRGARPLTRLPVDAALQTFPALFGLYNNGFLPSDIRIIGYARTKMDPEVSSLLDLFCSRQELLGAGRDKRLARWGKVACAWSGGVRVEAASFGLACGFTVLRGRLRKRWHRRRIGWIAKGKTCLRAGDETFATLSCKSRRIDAVVCPQEYHKRVTQYIKAPIPAMKKKLEEFLERCTYVSGQYDQDDGFEALEKELKKCEETYEDKKAPKNRVFYMALPPSVFTVVAANFKKHNYSEGGINRIIVEKPFGKDLESSREMQIDLKKEWKEEEVRRPACLLALLSPRQGSRVAVYRRGTRSSWPGDRTRY